MTKLICINNCNSIELRGEKCYENNIYYSFSGITFINKYTTNIFVYKKIEDSFHILGIFNKYNFKSLADFREERINKILNG